METKIYECAICKKLYKSGLKRQERYFGTRKAVRKHLIVVHGAKGRKNRGGLSKKEFGKSDITKNTIEYR